MLKRKRIAKRLSVGLSALAMAGSALTLVGWASGVRRLTDWFDLDISQLPNNAVGVLAGGAATLLLALGYRRASALLALAAGLIGGATLLEHIAGIDLGIDALLLTHDWGHSATLVPGRMGVPGSTSLLLIGAAIFLSVPERTRGLAAAGGVLVIAIATVSIIGYALQARLFYTIPHLTTIALQTAVMLLALGIALVAAIPDRLPTRLLVEDSAAALLVLSSLPGIVLVPMLIGGLTLEGERAGLFDTAFATAAMVLVLILLLLLLLWRTAHGVHRYERALRESQGRLSAMLGSITDAFMTLDSEWRFVFVNDHSEAHWGLPREAMLGSMIWEKLPEAVGTEAHRQLHLAMERRITVEYEYFHAPMNKWFGSRAYPTEDGGLAVYSRDITDRKGLEESLMSSEERLRLALEAGRMGVWDWHVRSGDLKWSDSLEPLHGLAPGTFGGTMEHFQQLIHPDDREIVNTAIRQALEGCGEFYVEFRNLRENGGIHWIAGSGKVFPGDDGQPLRMLGIGLDVTQRKRAEQTARFLADASAILAQLVEFDSTLQKISSLAVPSFADWATVDVAEADGSLRRVSVSHIDPAKVQLAREVHRRFPPDPAAPQGAWNILQTGLSEIVPEITDEMLVQSINDEEQLGIIRQLGLKSYIGVPLTVRGKTLAVITFINAESGHRYDHTDLAVAEDLASRAAIAIENAQLYRELRDADLRKDEFLATLAHELRNPLAPIGNGLQVLRLSGGSGEMADEARLMMERQLSQMVRLVDDLLDVSRITQNKLELRKERVSLSSVVNSAAETSRPLMEQAGHTLSVRLPTAPVFLDADPTRLAQVFSNLLNNAAKYTETGGRITLTAETSGTDVVVEVQDNGLGIPADALPRIFKMFSQVDRNMERAQGGLGIGLSLVLRLVELHGGTIEARSDGPGRGSQFVVRLPIAKATRPSVASPGDGALSEAASRRILIVDDNYDSAWSLSVMLVMMGNETHIARDGLAAVEAAEAFRPNLILLDIGMPKLNGYEACRRIREQPWSEGMVIVALTGWGQDEDRRRSQEAGFDHHLVKPVDIVDINRLLAEPNP